MVISSGRAFLRFSGTFLSLVLSASCSDTGAGPIAELSPFVGVWDAQALTFSNPDDPSQVLNLVDQGAAYTLSILSTGQYTTVFNLLIAQGVESGTISVSGDQVILTPVSPPGPALSGTYMFQGDLLIFDALTLLDYDQDGEDEAVAVHFEFGQVES